MRSSTSTLVSSLRGPVTGAAAATATFVAALLAVRFVYWLACGTHRKHREAFPRSGHEKELDERIAERCHLTHHEERITVRGRVLYRQVWAPKDAEPVAVCLYLHGLNGYGAFVANAAETFCEEHGMALVAIDHHSFGRSDGLHAHVTDTMEQASDVDAHVRSLAQLPEFRGLPIFVLGSSMGGLLALRYAAELAVAPQVKGLVLWAPAVFIHPERNQPAAVRLLARLLRFLWPSMPMVPQKPPGGGAFQSAAQEELERQHPLMYEGALRVSTGLALYDGCNEVRRSLHKVTLPVLIQHGLKDTVCDVEGSRTLYRAVSSRDREIIEYPNGYHVLSRDEGHDVAVDACSWMVARL